MKHYKIAITGLVAIPVVFLAVFSAWAEPEQAGDEITTSIEEVNTSEEATGLEIIMDGSSLDAFEKSMERVKETGTEVEYKSLKGAIDYLLIYDIGARNDLERLAARLDGVTAEEVVSRVKWRKK